MAIFAAPYIRRSANFNVDSTGNVTLAGAIAASGNVSAGSGQIVLASSGNILLGGVSDPSNVQPTLGIWGLDGNGQTSGFGINVTGGGGCAILQNALFNGDDLFNIDGVDLGMALVLLDNAGWLWLTVDNESNVAGVYQINYDGSGFAGANQSLSWDAYGGMAWAGGAANVDDNGNIYCLTVNPS